MATFTWCSSPSKSTLVETVAVCDLWSLARERRAAQVERRSAPQPRTYKHSEDMLGRADIDGVMIATADFQHAQHCAAVVSAGKDCYVEKPFATTLEEAKAGRAAVKSSKQVVQMGSQHRTQPYQLAVRDLVQSGRIGPIVKISQEWNVNMERWHGRPAVKELREEDTDWKRWLLDRPYQPFDPQIYLEFRLYRNFSSGIFSQWMSHASDLVHLWTNETHPERKRQRRNRRLERRQRESRYLQRGPHHRSGKVSCTRTPQPSGTATAASLEFRERRERSIISEARAHLCSC